MLEDPVALKPPAEDSLGTALAILDIVELLKLPAGRGTEMKAQVYLYTCCLMSPFPTTSNTPWSEDNTCHSTVPMLS